MAVHVHWVNKCRTISAKDRQIHLPSQSMRSCVCEWMWYGLRGNRTKKNYSFTRICYTFQWWWQSSRHYTVIQWTSNNELHEYTCNLLICLICPTIRRAWLSLCHFEMNARHVCETVYWMLLAGWRHNLFDDVDTDCYDENWSPRFGRVHVSSVEWLTNAAAAATNASAPKLHGTSRWNRKM